MHGVEVQCDSEAEWLEARRFGVCGSDVSAILGLSKYRTPLQVWSEKTMGVQQEETDLMRAGKRLEPLIVDIFCEEKAREVVRKKNTLFIHPENEILRGSVDGLIVPTRESGYGILEAKFVQGFVHRHWDNVVPMDYYLQLQHYLNVLGLEWGYFAILVDGWKFKEYRMAIDRKLVERVTEQLLKWWDRHIVGGEPPPIATEEDASLLYAQAEIGKTIEATGEILLVSDAYKAASIELKNKEAELGKLRCQLKSYMGNAEILAADGMKVHTWKTDKNGTRRWRDCDNDR